MIDIEKIIQERKKYFEWKNIKPLKKIIDSFDAKANSIDIRNTITIKANNSDEEILKVAKSLMPWRKGPFKINNILIDSEWRSFIKYNILKSHIDITDKVVADVGCNNGYYMFRMLENKPKKIIGFDPSPLFNLQFNFINKFIKSDISYELLGIEHIKDYFFKFDVIFCMGVLYHRDDIVQSLKNLYASLNDGGEIIIDTLIIPGDDDICLFPEDRYAGMKNVYFLPTTKALKNMLKRAGFTNIELITTLKTTLYEQRKTNWIESYSLNNFLDSDDIDKTIEGYFAPTRAYIKGRKGDRRD